jgi:basic membrane protein A and related proteins
VRKPLLAAVAVTAALAVIAAGCGGKSGSKSGITAALVSDIGKFNDRGFNQNQLAGLTRAETDFGINAVHLQSNSVSDYIPNLTTAVRDKADLVISAGFLLADATATMAKKFPDTHFAITDYPVEAPPFADKNGSVLYQNVQGLTYAANESGCLVGVLAAKMAEQAGKNVIGAVMGVKIPPVDVWTAGYKFCAQKAVPGMTVLTGYSQDFVATDKCKTVAENQISQGAYVLFQVAGGCGLGTLKAADEAGIWGIGVDVDQYDVAGHVLTSAIKRVDNGVYQAIEQVKDGKFAGGSDLVFNLKNDGVGVGKINPDVPQEFIDEMNTYKDQIIAGTLTVPTALS